MIGQNWKSKARRNLGVLLAVGVLSSLLAGSLALAEGPKPTTPDFPPAQRGGYRGGTHTSSSLLSCDKAISR